MEIKIQGLQQVHVLTNSALVSTCTKFQVKNMSSVPQITQESTICMLVMTSDEGISGKGL